MQEQGRGLEAAAPLRVTMQGDLAGRAGSRRYAVTAISAGVGNGLVYGGAVLEAAVPLFEGVPVFVDHAQLGERMSQTGGRSVRNVLGVLERVGYDTSPPAPLPTRTDACGEGGCIYGELRVYPGPDAEWFTAMVDQHLLDVAEGRASPRIGLSAVLDVVARGEEVVSIEKVVSVDVVFDPARGGQFLKALNQRLAVGSSQLAAAAKGMSLEDQSPRGDTEYLPPRGGAEYSKGGEMAEEGTGSGVSVAGGAPESAPGLASPGAGGAVAAESAPGGAGAVATLPVAGRGVERAVPPAAESAAGGEIAVPVAAALSEMLLDARLGRANLPDALRTMVRKRYAGQVFHPADLDADLEALQSAWAASVAASGRQVTGVGARVSEVVSEVDRLQAVMDRLCGLQPQSELLQGIPPVSGIRELYLMLTGDYEFRGVVNPQRVALANVTTANLTSLVKNAFNKVILDYFNTIERWWEPVVSQEGFGSMQDVTLITLGGFADLDTVTEGNAYTEKSWSDTEEVVSFIKKGNYVGVTLEMMDKDDTRAFRVIPRKLAIAGYRTLSAAIAALWTANSGVGAYWPSSQSTYRLFDAQYSNLGTSALSASSWDATIQAMYKQAEATSSERMGIRPSFIVVPIELEKTALTILQSPGEPGTADNDANVRRGSSRVIVCPEMTDANDWLAVADPRVWPSITVGFRFGAVPEVFVADQETVGSMFTNDEMRIKVRYIFAVGVGEPKALYKHNVS